MFINVQGTRLAVTQIVLWREMRSYGVDGVEVVMTHGIQFFGGISTNDFDHIVCGKEVI